ncbi:hypothetical protein NDI85_21345 [Halomicroarcula sp. S1AR25-4]|uniref:hypothetical protein n=1 Tax=Haloarcula sp. S1AR25-4 TaxID=2950538 RepID=UPI002875486E|nr:hypothetical protein [Halomicroarcula sp. S1AR25-4]MDS0280334.1 hypothetical protein [Halomicroarcula sp. S1AR25-4]
MADAIDVSANFCPECGQPVESAQSFAVDEDIIEQGAFEKVGAHAVVESGQISIYSHGEGSA